MMQDAVREKAQVTSDLRTVEIEQGSQTPSSQTVEKTQVIPISQSNFGPDMSGSDDEEASEVDSFILDENDVEESEGVLEPAKFLLAAETEEGQTLQTVDPETHARLEALLEAAGISKLSSKDGKALTDPEVLRTLTSSVSSALDEATQAINCMRSEQQGQLQGEGAQALTERDVGTVRKLYESGSVPDTTEEGESLLSLACSAGYYELAQVLLAMNANVEDRGIKGDCTPLMEAASGGYLEIVRLLILHGADVNAQSSAGNTPLHSAACGGHVEVVKELITSGASVEVHNENGHTPLMEAASAGYVEVARLLLEAGAGINTHSNEFKESALTLACYKGHLEMVKFLLEAGADQEHKTDEMHTALMEASMDGHVEVARLLLDSGAQVNMPADSFESPLTLAACGGHVELANLLIERGANIEEVNDEGYTPLMEAAREGHEEMVALLLSHGADINAQTEETQETALTLACCGGFLEVADFLIKAGADIELGCSTPLMEAAQEGHLDLVRYLLGAGANVHAQTGTCDTALTYACENGHTDVAEVLLEHGAVLEHDSEGGRTPLMKAARAGHMCTVQFLISKGADVNRATSTNDHTVLSLACAGGHLSVVELLLANGADISHRLKDGSTMIIEASKGGHAQVVKLLLEWPNRLLLTSSVDLAHPDLTHMNLAAGGAVDEPRVPVQGLANIVPPSEPDSQLPGSHNFGSTTGKSQESLRATAVKAASKRIVNGAPGVEGKGGGPKSINVMGDSLQQLSHEGAMLADFSDEKATEKVEAIINNIMAKELLAPSASSREEQIQRKQQILEELQKVEKELQEKAQAQQQLEQQQQLLKARSASAAIPAAVRQAEETKKAMEVNLACAAASRSSSLTESLCLTQPAVDSPLSDLVVQLPKLLSSGELAAAAHSLMPHAAYPDAYIQHPATSSPQLVLPPQLPVSTPSSTMGTLISPSQQQAQQAAAGGGGTSQGSNLPCGNGGGVGVKTSNKRNSSGKVQRSKSQQIQQQQQVLSQQQQPPLPPPPPQQQLPLSPQPLSSPPMSLAFQSEHMGGSHFQEGVGMSAEALQQQQLAALTQQQPQQHMQQLALPPLTQDQLLHHMISHQVLQAPMGQPFQQPLHQLLPQQPPQPALLTHQERAQLIQQTQQAQLLQHQLLKQAPGTNAASAVSPSVVGSTSGGEAAGVISDKSQGGLYPTSVDVDSQTESNHDTALTLACAGGHAELVSLLLAKGADIEHRDKKGFTPLILAATAGHVDVVEILLEHGAEIEAQSERTKDTPLSLACSGGRYEVVELLLTKGANKEHRNVSDYTPLSLAASGGYVNIIKLLLSHGAEINSRTGSKLGISPLMLAAMNGHTAAVKLLLDMGSDINAQIETNRNTALTLACFQGRHEVVSLLVDRKANIEHRAKTGLTPLMEAASGGYVEVGRVLLDKGADVNAAPVPSSRDTALTIAADKGHYRFVELLLHRGAAVDVKNKKGNSPLWLACNGGHLDVVQLLVSAGADVDSQDNRKVSCLMAAFRKGHVKVVKWKVKHVTQFPSDAELQRFIATVTDKELQKKCQQCMDIIVTAKDRQAAEANKNATSLLLEIDKERQVEEHRRLQAAKRRERRKAKKREKLKEKDKDKNSSPEPEGSENHLEDNDDDEYDDQVEVGPPSATVTSTIGTTLVKNTEAKSTRPNMIKLSPSLSSSSSSSSTGPALTPPGNAVTSSTNSQSISSTISNSSSATELKKNRRNRKEKIEGMELKRNHLPSPSSPPASVSVSMATSLAVTIAMMTNAGGKLGLYSIAGNNSSSSNTFTSSNSNNNTNSSKCKKNDIIKQPPPSGKNRVGDLDDFGSVSGKVTYKDVDKLGRNLDKVKIAASDSMCLVERDSNLAPKLSPLGTSPRKGQRKDEGWKEVTRKSKKVQVPANAISRVIGRGGCNINAIRETSGAHVEVEKPKGSGDRFIMIKGSAEATRQAHAMINALVQEPDKDLSEIISRTKGKPVEKIQQTQATIGDFAIGMFSVPTTSATTTSGNGQHSGKTSTSGKSQSNRQASTPSTALNGMRLSSSTTGPPITVWQNQQSNSGTPASPRRSSPQKQLSSNASSSTSMPSLTSVTANQEKGISRQLFSSEPHRRAGSATPTTSSSTPPSFNISNPTLKSSVVTVGRNSTDRQQTPTNIGTSSTSSGSGASSISSKTVGRPGSSSIRLLQRQGSGTTRSDPQPLPIVSSHVSTSISPATTSVTSSAAQASPGNYSPFESTIFSNVTVQFLNKKEDEKLNFASVAAAGVVPSQSSPLSGQPPSGLPGPGNEVDPNLQAKAPGYKMGIRTASPQSRPEQANRVSANMHFQLPLGGGCYPGPSLPPGVSMPPRPSLPNPSSDGGNMSPHNPPHMSSLDHMASQHSPMVQQQLSQTPLHHPLSSNQKEEYSTPHQPMTLPEIKSTLNPNAPDFCVMGSGIVSTPSSLVNGFASSGMGDGRVGSDLGNGMGGGGGNNSAGVGDGDRGVGIPTMNNLQALQQQLQQSMNFSPAALHALHQQLLSMQMMNPQTFSTALSQSTNLFAQAAAGGSTAGALDQLDLAHMSYFVQQLTGGRIPLVRSSSPGIGQPMPVPMVPSAGPVGPHHLVHNDGPGGGAGSPGVGPGPGPISGFMMPQGMQRNMSPMPGNPHRPQSAPSLPDPGSSGPMHPPSIGSPMPPLTPPLLDNKQGLEDRRVPRPIGGERAQRKLPLSSASSGFGGVGEFGNKLWCFSSDTEWMSSTSPQMSAAPLPSSVMTSSVVTGGNMAYNLSSFQREGHSSGVALDSVGTFPDSLGPADRSLDPTMQSQQMMLPMFVNGLQGPFPIQHQPIFTSRGGGGGGGGDHGGSLPTMWSQGIKTGPSEAGDGEPWRNWSRTDM